MDLFKVIGAAIEYLSTGPDDISSELRTKQLTNLFITNFLVTYITSTSLPIRESLILPWGKSLQSGIMMATPILSFLAQFVVASASSTMGPAKVLIIILNIMSVILLGVATSLLFSTVFEIYIVVLYSLFASTFLNITTSLFWYVHYYY